MGRLNGRPVLFKVAFAGHKGIEYRLINGPEAFRPGRVILQAGYIPGRIGVSPLVNIFLKNTVDHPCRIRIEPEVGNLLLSQVNFTQQGYHSLLRKQAFGPGRAVVAGGHKGRQQQQKQFFHGRNQAKLRSFADASPPLTLMNENLLARLRNYEIKIRKAVDTQLHGNFRSVFKGSGLEFNDLRPYQFGDDIRLVDWNASSKGHGMFSKLFQEEKSQTVFFLLDVSASQEIGPAGRTKMEVGREICGVLTLAAMREASHIGLCCFSDQKEKYIRPASGARHGYQLILELFRLQPASAHTDLTAALLFTLNRVRRRSLIILVSDFIDEGYEQSLKALIRKHDVVVIHLFDAREVQFPKMGILPVLDRETRQTYWVNTTSAAFQQNVVGQFQQQRQKLEQLCKQYRANYLSISTQEDYVPPLIRLFKVRK